MLSQYIQCVNQQLVLYLVDHSSLCCIIVLFYSVTNEKINIIITSVLFE